MMQYFEDLLHTIGDSLRTLDEKKLDSLINDCCGTLKSGHKIVASGLGKNVPICEKFVGTLNSLGLDAAFLHTNSAVHGDMGNVNAGDLVILLTKSGETAESVYLTGFLKRRGCSLWLLTFSRESTLTREIPNHLVMDLEHEGDAWNIMPNNSTTLNLIVLQAVAMQAAGRLGLTLDDFRENHPGGHIGQVLN